MMKISVYKRPFSKKYAPTPVFIGQVTIYTGTGEGGKRGQKVYTMMSPIKRTTRHDAWKDAQNLKELHQIN